MSNPISDAIEALSAELNELFDAGDLEAIAFHFTYLRQSVAPAFSLLLSEAERFLIDAAPWSGDKWEVEGLPVLEVRRGKDRKQFRWDEVRPYLRRAVLDPEQSGELPAPEVVEAVDETLALLYAVAPLTGSNTPRVTQLAPILRGFDRDVDEFAEVKPGRVSIQIHGGENQ